MKTTNFIEFGKLSIISTLAVVGFGFMNMATAAIGPKPPVTSPIPVESPVISVDIKYKQTFNCFAQGTNVQVYENMHTLDSVIVVNGVFFVQNFATAGPILPHAQMNVQFLVGQFDVVEKTALFEKIEYTLNNGQHMTLAKTIGQPVPGGIGNTRFCGRGSCDQVPLTVINAELTLNDKDLSLSCDELN